MRILAALLLVTALSAVAPAQNTQGIQLAPGETLVSVNGVSVNNNIVQNGTSSSVVTTSSTTSSMGFQTSGVSLAQSKANRMASSRTLRHLGGGFGGGRYEGVGVGSTREAAIRNCCYWGQRTPIDIGAAQNGGRWYACVIYR